MSDDKLHWVPWEIHRIGRMIGHPETMCSSDGRRWFRSVPEPYSASTLGRVRAAWWVLTGRAHAVVWPVPGELEDALGKS